MNKAKILELADIIEATPHRDNKNIRESSTFEKPKPTHFNMRHWHCGTCACIGGFTDALFGETGALELDADLEDKLFYPSGFLDFKYNDIKPAHAAKVLRHLAETGEVDWSIIKPDLGITE